MVFVALVILGWLVGLAFFGAVIRVAAWLERRTPHAH